MTPASSSKQLTADTLAVTAGTVARSLSQALLLVIVARTLGPESYAALTALFSIALVVAVLSGAGTHVLLVRDVASGRRSVEEAWGGTLSCLAVSAGPLTLLGMGLGITLGPGRADLSAVAAICVAEIALSPWCVVSAATFQAQGAMRTFALLSITPSLARLLAGIGLLATAPTADAETLTHWAHLYVAASLVAALLCHGAARHFHGPPLRPSLSQIVHDVRVAWPFAASSLAQSVYGAVDKVLVVRLCEGPIAGAYALAIRLVELATIPAWSAVSVLAPRLFKAELDAPLSHAARIDALRRLVIPPIVLSVAMVALTPLLPHAFGMAYAETTQLVAMLAVMPGIMALRIFLHLRLNTSGRQKGAAAAVVLGSVSSAALNSLLLPSLAAIGAVIALLASELLMIACMTAMLHLSRPR